MTFFRLTAAGSGRRPQPAKPEVFALATCEGVNWPPRPEPRPRTAPHGCVFATWCSKACDFLSPCRVGRVFDAHAPQTLGGALPGRGPSRLGPPPTKVKFPFSNGEVGRALVSSRKPSGGAQPFSSFRPAPPVGCSPEPSRGVSNGSPGGRFPVVERPAPTPASSSPVAPFQKSKTASCQNPVR